MVNDSLPVAGAELRGHIPALDGIRGLAILLVLCAHGGFPVEQPNLLEWLITRPLDVGWTGVDLFFVLSGFLITGILLDAREAPAFFRNFYMRRVLRIFPLYYGTLLLLCTLLPRIPSYVSPPIQTMLDHQAWAWLYSINIFRTFYPQFTPSLLGHFWSLAVEEHFYFIWPLLVWLCPRRVMLWVCVLFVVAAAAMRIVFVTATPWAYGANIFTLCRMDALASGALLALLARGPKGLVPYRKVAAIVVLPCVLALTPFFCFRPLHPTLDPLFLCVGYTLLSALFGSLMILTLTSSPRSILQRVFQSRPMTILGKYAYGLYVIHFPLILLLTSVRIQLKERLLAAIPLRCGAILSYYVIVFGLSFLLAFLSYNLFEKHFLKLKRFFEYRVAKPAAVPAFEETVR